ncbi:estradiol 17-beta-dehydrogenase 1 isoform X2 [Gopherus evgoodei]|uniref:estradiol 17-beta-dehydrogenase 1 isoform X2 n=1 Tax=Gopherus evgoodei TaxID=1825980 RepID=UPI0011D0152E|nr:estradiol 17-beta-dehydrogenase 1 isoform X2 [Gopherus evgoodei]
MLCLRARASDGEDCGAHYRLLLGDRPGAGCAPGLGCLPQVQSLRHHAQPGQEGAAAGVRAGLPRQHPGDPAAGCHRPALARCSCAAGAGAARRRAGTIQAFLPGMKRRKAGKIIISSSVGALQGIPFNAVYCASKFAVEGLCESLAVILQQFNMHITLIECGPVNTSFLANLQHSDTEGSALQGLDPQTRTLYSQYLQHCQSLFRDVAQDTEEVLQVFLEAICAPCPPLRSFTTQVFMPLTRLKLTSPDGSEYIRAMHKFVFSAGEAQGDRT